MHSEDAWRGEPTLLPDQATGPNPSVGRPLVPGDPVGRYVITSVLGAGGMGIVYAADDPELDRRVALKLLQTDAGRGERRRRARQRLQSEAKSMAQLNHPNVVAVHDVGEHQGQVFVAMQLVDGLTLTRWRRKLKSRPWTKVLDVFVAAGRGLAAAHAAGLVHGDFKPDNVMIGTDGHVRVMDFGLARQRPTIGESEPTLESKAVGPDGAPKPAEVPEEPTDRHRAADPKIAGTPAYMAPEQHHGRDADAHSDQFAFCVALYEALYGQRPFGGDNLASLAVHVTQGEIRATPRQFGIPRWVRRVVLRGLSTDPADRYPSMDALLAALDRKALVWRRRAALVGGVVLAVGGTTSVLYVAGQHRSGLACASTEPLDAAWNDQRQDAIRRAMLDTGTSFAADSWARADESLDAYARSWADLRTTACDATFATGHRSRGELERTLQCLDHRLLQLDETVTALSERDSVRVEHAVDAVAQLPAVHECEQPDGSTGVPPPDADAAEVRAVRRRAARLRVLRTVGRPELGLDEAVALPVAADGIGYPPAVAEALLASGRTLAAAGRVQQGQAELVRAYFTARRADHDRITRDAAIAVVGVMARADHDDEATAWAAHAEAEVARSGDTLDRARLERGLAAVARARGQRQAALVHEQRALELREAGHGGDHHVDLGRSRVAVGMELDALGRHGEAAKSFDAGLADLQHSVGPLHPATAQVHERLATALVAAGQLESAQQHLRDAATILRDADAVPRATKSEPSPRVLARARVLQQLGRVLAQMGELAEAEGHLAQALRIRESGDDASAPAIIDTLVELAVVVHGRGRPAEAIGHLRRALEHDGPGATMVHAELTLATIARDIGDYARAHAALESAAARVPATDPLHTTVLIESADVLRERGRTAAARKRIREALDQLAGPRNPAPDATLRAHALVVAAAIELPRAQAAKPARAALALLETQASPALLARARFVLAQALWADPKLRSRAQALAMQAQGTYARRALAEVTAWLQTHQGPTKALGTRP